MLTDAPQPINDPVLGELTPHIQAGEFSGVWEGLVDLPCFGEPLTFWVTLLRPEDYLSGAPISLDFRLSNLQAQFFTDLANNCASYKQQILQAMLRGLKDPAVWGMFEEDSEEYSLITAIKDTAELEQNVSRPHLYLLPDVDAKVVYGFGYWETEWDEEHGYGVRFIGHELVESGSMEVAQG